MPILRLDTEIQAQLFCGVLRVLRVYSLACLLAGLLACLLAGLLACLLAGLLAGWLAGLLAGLLACRLAGLPAGLPAQLPACPLASLALPSLLSPFFFFFVKSHPEGQWQTYTRACSHFGLTMLQFHPSTTRAHSLPRHRDPGPAFLWYTEGA